MIDGPTDIDRGFLNMSQVVFVLVVSLIFCASVKNISPILTKSSSGIVFVFQRMAVFISDSIET